MDHPLCYSPLGLSWVHLRVDAADVAEAPSANTFNSKVVTEVDKTADYDAALREVLRQGQSEVRENVQVGQPQFLTPDEIAAEIAQNPGMDVDVVESGRPEGAVPTVRKVCDVEGLNVPALPHCHGRLSGEPKECRLCIPDFPLGVPCFELISLYYTYSSLFFLHVSISCVFLIRAFQWFLYRCLIGVHLCRLSVFYIEARIRFWVRAILFDRWRGLKY